MDLAGALSLDRLAADPYPAYAELRRRQPVAWISELGMWWVTRYDDVRGVLLNDRDFVTGTPASLLFGTFGEQMLTVDGPRHAELRTPRLNGRFMPASIRTRAAARIDARVSGLLDGFAANGRAELRNSFAARLPVLVMLDIFGLPDGGEPRFRAWYDAFEAALSNHSGSGAVRDTARDAVEAFHRVLQAHIDAWRAGAGRPGLLADFLSAPEAERLSDAEIRRNALIIFFGGISTVEAVILNMVWALLTHPRALERVRQNRDRLEAVFDETVRWTSPVQSATRHTVRPCEVAGVRIPPGATVNCMLASANRDESVFDDPDRFDIDRPNAHKNLGFAVGPHFCLGRHLARAEALAAINGLLDLGDALRLVEPFCAPTGHEFRQPASLSVAWD